MKTFDTKTSWEATVTGERPDEQVFLRRGCGQAQVVVCVGLDGFDYNRYNQRTPVKWQQSTRGRNIHMAMNGGAQFTFAEFEELNQAIFNAQCYLQGIFPRNAR